MSESLINHSPDLSKLRCEGYEVDTHANHLVIRNVPYVCCDRAVKRGILVSTLDINNNRTITPQTHVVYFIGDYPCDHNGNRLESIVIAEDENQLAENLVVNFEFSSKPIQGYIDYYQKMTQYIRILSNYAREIDPTVTAQTFQKIETSVEDSVFVYPDTASTRAGITAISSKLKLNKIAIIGLGGTGSYILDLVSKTHVKEIHLFDDDDFQQHNAFRSPGVASMSEFEIPQKKVEYIAQKYKKFRYGIIPHVTQINDTNVNELIDMEFVFISIDGGEAKLPIVNFLETHNVPFIDVGMDISIVNNHLRGVLRVTTSTPEMRKHVHDKKRIGFGTANVDGIYNQNIQTADLNSLNASLAVIKWKKYFGFYADIDKEHYTSYTLDGNGVVNDDLQQESGEI